MSAEDIDLRTALWCVSDVVRRLGKTGIPISPKLLAHQRQLLSAIERQARSRPENDAVAAQLQDVLGAREAAELLGRGTRYIQNHAKELGGHKISCGWIFTRTAIEEEAQSQ